MLKKCVLLLFTSLFFSTNSAHSTENFTIRGLQLGMTIDQFRSTFENLGYKCKSVEEGYFDCEGPETDFKSNWARMFLDKKKRARALLIRCGVTESCHFKVDQIVSLLKISGRFPDNTIELEVEADQAKYTKAFTTPSEYMSINCHWSLSFDHCYLLINTFSRYPKF